MRATKAQKNVTSLVRLLMVLALYRAKENGLNRLESLAPAAKRAKS